MKKGLTFLLIADAFSNLGLGMIGPIYAIFVEKIGGDILDASWAFFSFTITAGVAIFLIGKWENRIHHKEKLVAGGYFLTSLGCLGYVFVQNQFELLVVQIILGLATAILNPAFDALYSHYVIREQETSDWGSWEASGFIMGACAALLGGYIVHFGSFNTLFLCMFAVEFIGFLISLSLFSAQKKLNIRLNKN